MVDTAPPTRLSVVERGGRLVVIDKKTGETPPTAAERMAAHDRERGVEAILPPKLSAPPDLSDRARAESGLSARPAPMQSTPKAARPKPRATDQGKARVAAAIAERSKQPWGDQQDDRPAAKAERPPARIASRPAPKVSGERKTIVTSKWWDSKGPRTIELGPKGQASLSGGFVTIAIGLLVAVIATLIIQPVITFVGAFLLFRFGGTVFGPIGAGIVDKALAERN